MRKFIILSTQRSGTTYLVNYLDSHPAIECGLELFLLKKYHQEYEEDRFYNYCSHSSFRNLRYRVGNIFGTFYNSAFTKRMMVKDGFQSTIPLLLLGAIRPRLHKGLASSFLNEYFGCSNKRIEAKGFKLLYSQANMFDLNLNSLSKKGYKIIHLLRRNPLNIIVSIRRKEISGIVHSKTKEPQIKIEIDIDNLVRKLDILSNTVKYYKKLLTGQDCIEIFYEDFFANKEAETNRMLGYLNVGKCAHLSCELIKITNGNLEEIISNYSDVHRTLKGTEYERFL